MSRQEWVVADSRLLKTDFEHHGQGKNELGMTDPAYDLADAIFHFRLSEKESAQLVHHYVQESGDIHVEKRLFLNKLLAGLWAQNLAKLGLQNLGLLHRRRGFPQQSFSAGNFFVGEPFGDSVMLC